ncbi:hypothetical protein VTN77DRAFT_6453 [Rasamsonia byssochlamydoides]|uniref:uncharacterized protein n=1 Tax=Rasamsonia byssochlamydoides TaxID=89139 RepID=UPI00374291A7
MGVCLSCLGLGRRESHDSESARLLDDDLYPGGYGYGSVNHAHQHQADPEDLKREREALEAICQRASDSVIDIWALQPQPHLQPRAALRSNGSIVSTRVPSGNETPAIHITEHADDVSETQQQQHEPKRTTAATQKKKPATVPKHWGEVVITPRKGKKLDQDNGNDFFGVLKVT